MHIMAIRAIITSMANKRQRRTPLDTSPLEGEVASRRQARGGRGVKSGSKTSRHPPPHPPSRGEGAGPVAIRPEDRIGALGEAAQNGFSAALYRLMAWLSPAYPVGAFSYSGGLEWAVEAGDVGDAHALLAWLGVVIGGGGPFFGPVRRPPLICRRSPPISSRPACG